MIRPVAAIRFPSGVLPVMSTMACHLYPPVEAKMSWIQNNDPSGFSLQIPEGWQVQQLDWGTVIVFDPQGGSLALLQRLAAPIPGTPAEILQFGRFSSARLFRQAQPGPIESIPGGGVATTLRFPFQDGTPALARVSCRPDAAGAMVTACAGPAAIFAESEPSIRYIVESFSASDRWPGAGGEQPGSTAQPVPPGGHQTVMQATLPAGTPPLFVSYTDPQLGAFTVDVPRGWRVQGGLNHPSLGDRRPFVQVESPDGIQVLFGDPECPQSFYHVLLGIEGTMVPYATGCAFLNLRPSAERLAQYYLKSIAPKRIGPFQMSGHRDRRDVIDRALDQARKNGTTIPRGLDMEAHEVNFLAGARSGSCLGASAVNRGASFGFGTMWEGNVTLWLAPPALMPMAEQVAMRLMLSYRPTARMYQLVQQDEMAIAGNGMVANMGQQQWFAAQQAGHQAQLGFGNAIVGNYWQQQQVNDGLMQSYTDRQQSEDRVFQNYSDATLDRQRLTDDGMGKSYEVASGSNYYWVDQQSGQVIGTNTDQPPDVQRNYTQLRKE